MRHYAKYQNDEFIVLGHNVKYNNCLVVRTAALTNQDLTDLRMIANSRVAQEEHFYLMPVLTFQPHRSGKSWESYLLEQLPKRGGPVMTLPLKDLQDSLDSEQRSFWKGYGRPAARENKLPPLSSDGQRLQEALVPGYTNQPEVLSSMMVGHELPEGNFIGHAGNSPSNALDRKLDEVIVTMTDENQMTRASINTLAESIQALVGALSPKPAAKGRPAKKEEQADAAE